MEVFELALNENEPNIMHIIFNICNSYSQKELLMNSFFRIMQHFIFVLIESETLYLTCNHYYGFWF